MTVRVSAIEITGLSKRYGSTLAVDDLSFRVEPGRVVGFLGPNGAGKTTTLRALLGLVTPDGRHRHGRGPALRGARGPRAHGRRRARRRDAAPGPQRAQPPADAGRAARASRARASTSCSSSSGSRRRPTAARAATRSACASGSGSPAALLGDPRVLVLDEPANGLDPQGIRWLRDFLRALAAEGRAVLVSSHVLAEVAQTAHEVVVIAHGRSVAQAPLEELLATRAGGVRVAGPDVGRLAELLRVRRAPTWTRSRGGALVVHDRTRRAHRRAWWPSTGS